MRRKLNVPFLAGLLAGGLLLGVSLYLLYGFQVRRHASALLSQADRAQEQENLDQAARYLARYLTLRPEDIDVLARYGLLLAQRAQSPLARGHAVAVLDRVLQRLPGRADVRRRRARLALALGHGAEAQEDLTTLLRSAPEDGELEDLLGQCAKAGGQPASAADWFARASKHAPGQI